MIVKAQAVAYPQECNDYFIDEIEVTSRLINLVLDMPVKEQLDLLKKIDSTGYKGARKQPRTLLKNPWVVMIGPERKDASTGHHIKDISRCGMLIETESTFGIGEKILLTFQMPASQKTFKIVGEVVRFQKNTIGVKFKRRFSSDSH